jgi:hypothetical protein
MLTPAAFGMEWIPVDLDCFFSHIRLLLSFHGIAIKSGNKKTRHQPYISKTMSNKARVSPRRVVICWGAAAVMGCVTVNSASASLVAFDPFLTGDNRIAGEYTPGNDMRSMGAAAVGWVGTSGLDGYGVAHSGSTGNFLANASDNGMPTIGGIPSQPGRMQWIGVGNFPFNRNITRQLNPTPSSSEWWMSLTLTRLSWTGAPADNTFIVGGFTDAGGNGLQLGYDDSAGQDGIPDIVLRTGGVNYQIEADAPDSSTRYLLVKLDVNTSGPDTVSIWNTPASVLSLGAADVVLNVEVTGSLTPFTQSKYESPGQSGAAYFDEILLGTDLTSIIPEPGSMALCLVGAGGLLALRRRKG